MTNLEAKNGLDAMCFEVTIIKVLGKRFNDLKGKMIFEVMVMEIVDSVKVSIETKVVKCQFWAKVENLMSVLSRTADL